MAGAFAFERRLEAEERLLAMTPEATEVGMHEWSDLAVHYGDDVAGFVIRAQILYQCIRLEHI